MKCLYIILCTVACSNAASKAEEEEKIREQIVHDLGLSRIPDVHKANISAEEYALKLDIYRQSMEQTNAIRELQDHFMEHLESTAPSTSTLLYTGLKRGKRSIHNSVILKFDLVDLQANIGAVFVTSARLTVNLRQVKDGSFPGLLEDQVCAIQLVKEEEGLQLDCSTSQESDEEMVVVLDVTHALQAWMIDPATDLGILIRAVGWEIEGEPAVAVEYVVGDTPRVKRDLFRSTEFDVVSKSKTDCKSGSRGRCCRQSMPVDLRQLKGFEFIMQPDVFDAYYCKGKCHSRDLALNDHSLLQYFMHLRDSRVKKPCCSPRKYESRDILHLDEMDSTRLKVTNWKNIIVRECACA